MGRYALTDGGFVIDKEDLFQSRVCTSKIVDNKLIETYKLSTGEELVFTYEIIKEADHEDKLFM